MHKLKLLVLCLLSCTCITGFAADVVCASNNHGFVSASSDLNKKLDKYFQVAVSAPSMQIDTGGYVICVTVQPK